MQAMEDREKEAYDFWERVDEKRGKIMLAEIAQAADVKNQTIRDMRSKCRIPKMPVVRAIADYIGTSAEYLLTGKETTIYDMPEVEFVRRSPEAQTLIRAVMRDPALLSALSAVIASTEKQLQEPRIS